MKSVQLILSLCLIKQVTCDHWSIGQLGNHNPNFFPGRPVVFAPEDCDTQQDWWATRVTDSDGQDSKNFFDSYQQSLAFEVQAGRPQLFSIQPAMTDGRGPYCPVGGPNPTHPYIIPAKPNCEKGDLTGTDGMFGEPSLEDRGGISLLTFKCAPDQCGCSTVSVQLVDDGVEDCVVGGNGPITAPTRIAFCPGGCNPDDCSKSIEHFFTICINCVNDCPHFSVPACNVQVNEDETNIEILNWASNINFGAPNEVDQRIWFEIKVSNPGLFSTQPFLQWDPAFPGVASLRFEPLANHFGTSEICVTIFDDGGVENGGCNKGAGVGAGGSATGTVGGETGQICCQIEVLPINDCPTWRPGRHDTSSSLTVHIEEDAGRFSVLDYAVQISAGPIDEENSQNLWFTLTPVTPANAIFFAQLPRINSETGELTFELLPDANTFGVGSFDFYIQLQDDGGRVPPPACDITCEPVTSCPVLRIIVDPVNDPAFFVPGPDISICEDEQPSYCYPNWARQITPGNLRESVMTGGEGQVISFDIAPDRPELFQAGPVIDPTTGTLCFTQTEHAFGATNVLITIRDDGPTATGPPENSGTSIYTRILINPSNDAPTWQQSPLTMNGATCIEVNQNPLEEVVTINGFAVNIMRGGGDTESEQQLTFELESTPRELFTTDPRIEMTSFTEGRLVFTPAANAFGTAMITVRLRDSGGIAGSGATAVGCLGVDMTIQTFCIAIRPTTTPPNLLYPNRICVDEDATNQPHAIPLFFQGVDVTCHVVELTVANMTSQSSFMTGLFVNLPTVTPDGTLTFTTERDAFGEATIVVTLFNTCVTPTSKTVLRNAFVICIRPCNDPPTFRASSNLISTISECQPTVGNDCCMHVLPSWAADITPVEIGQRVTFSVFALDESVFDPNHLPEISNTGTLSFCLKPYYTTLGVSALSVQLRDDGGHSGGRCTDTTIETIPFQILPINDRPEFIGLPETLVFNEDDGTVEVPGWATRITPGRGPDELTEASVRMLSFTCSPTDLTLINSCRVNTRTGNLVMDIVPDAFGITLLEIVLHDGEVVSGSSTPSYVSVTVLEINDRPTFTPLGAVIVFEDTCYSQQWAQLISVGPPNEVSQQASFIINDDLTSSNNVIRGTPHISSSGILSFCPRDNVNGRAIYRVVLQDSGGTLRGGIDNSIQAELVIVIVATNDCPVLELSSAYDPRIAIVFREDQQEDIRLTHVVTGSSIAVGPPTAQDEIGSQTVVLQVTTDPTSAFQQQLRVEQSPELDKGQSVVGILTPDFFGTVVVTFTAVDTGNGLFPDCNTSTSKTLVLVVDPVNDPPSFIKGPNIIISSQEQEQIRYIWPAWAQGIRAGPDNEAFQQLTFLVRSAAGEEVFGFFDGGVMPTISPTTGDLQVYPSPSPIGDRTGDFEACLSDGRDQVCESFTITLLQHTPSNNGIGTSQNGLSLQINEDSGFQQISPWFLLSGQTLSPDAYLSTPSSEQLLFFRNGLSPQVTVVNNTMTFEVLPDHFGMASVVLHSNGVEYPFTITVVGVNDAPFFNFVQPLPEIIVRQTSIASGVLLLTGTTSGPAEDSTQQVSFSVSANGGVVSDNQRFTPNTGLPSGVHLFNITALDSLGLSFSRQIEVIILPVIDQSLQSSNFINQNLLTVSTFEDAPEITIPNYAMRRANDPSDLSIEVSFNFNGTALSFFEIVPKTRPTVQNSSILELVYKPAANRFGTVSGFATVIAVRMVSETLQNAALRAGFVEYQVANQRRPLTPVAVNFLIEAVNDAPVIVVDNSTTSRFNINTTIPVIQLLEDTQILIPNFIIMSSAGGFGEDAVQHLQFNVEVVSNSHLIQSANIVVDGLQNNLQIIPRNHSNGESVLHITATDSLGLVSNREVVNVIITAVNDKPFFISSGNVRFNEDPTGGVYSTSWASDITRGPDDENLQRLQFTSTPTYPDITISISSDTGLLVVDVGSDVSGVFAYRIILSDDGGRTNSGEDSSVVHNLNISITEVNDPPVFSIIQQTLEVPIDAVPQQLQVLSVVSSGSPFEDSSGQTVAFIISVTDNRVFASSGQPVLSPSGLLSYALAGDRVGNVTLNIVATDSLGLRSTTQSSIHINIIPGDLPLVNVTLLVPLSGSQSLDSIQSAVSTAINAPPGTVVVQSAGGNDLRIFFKSTPGLSGSQLRDRFLALNPDQLTQIGVMRQAVQQPSTGAPVLQQTESPAGSGGSGSVSPIIIVVIVAAVIVALAAGGYYCYRANKNKNSSGDNNRVFKQSSDEVTLQHSRVPSNSPENYNTRSSNPIDLTFSPAPASPPALYG